MCKMYSSELLFCKLSIESETKSIYMFLLVLYCYSYVVFSSPNLHSAPLTLCHTQ